MIQKKEESYVKWFSELSNKNVSIAGGKGASLAEMYNAKVPVPPGFVVTAQAYSYFIKELKKIDKTFMEKLINVKISEGRVKCLMLPVNAIIKVLKSETASFPK